MSYKLEQEIPSVLLDKTYISEEYLLKNGFEKKGKSFILSWEYILEVEVANINDEAGIWNISVLYYDSGGINDTEVCTLGQLKLFLAIEGLFDLIEELK